jgi:hypothetical protein
MDLYNIKTLLNKYLEAESNLEEEKELKAYFLSGNVAPELQEYIPLFSFFEAEKNIVPEKEILFEEEEEEKSVRFLFNKRSGIATNFYKLVGVAASLAILISFFWLNSKSKTIPNTTNPVQQEIAMQNTQDLLYMMTDAVVSGKKQLLYLKEFNYTKNQLINK